MNKRIIVLGGSPKGAKSVTMQYVNYLKANFKEYQFVEYYIATEIRSIEKDDVKLQQIANDIKNSDAILWAFPLYCGLVHGSYKRFIELIWEKNIVESFKGKHCAILATSIHFFDHTAIEYIRGISEDLGMSLDEVHSAGMQDLLDGPGEIQLKLFFEQWVKKIKENSYQGRLTTPIKGETIPFSLDENHVLNPHLNSKLGLVTESGINENLDNMVTAMTREFSQVEVFDLSNMKIAGGCLGCLKCGYENHCVYEGKDEVIATYRKLKSCDVIVFAGAIKDRYLTAKWKTFIDRIFFTTHIPFFDKKVLGVMIAGPLRQIPNLRDLFTGFFESDGLTIAGIISDEDSDTAQQIHTLATSLDSYYQEGYHPPRKFPGVSGHMIFRDAIFGGLRGVFVADHKYYKKNGLYDFPHKNLGRRVTTSFMYLMMKLPFFRKDVQQNMAAYMVKPYNKVINKRK